MAEKKKRSHFGRHKLAYKAGYKFIAPKVLSKYDYRTDKAEDPGEPYIVMCNHTTEEDFIMVLAAFPSHMYFVCGEHLLRSKYAKYIKRYGDPIPMRRGGTTTAAVKEVIRRTKAGHNVMIFPEGCRSFDGETLPVTEAIGKMVKLSGAGLFTYRTRGGYFVAPRWAHKFRKGPVEGKIMGYYPAAELKKMTPAEIKAIIDRDLYENAYETQAKDPKPYTCDALAEGLENYLIICPECGSYDSMETKGDRFWCTCCGLGGRYDEYGYLVPVEETAESGKPLPFNTVYDWGKWMQKRFDEDMDRKLGAPGAAVDAEEDATGSTLLFEETDVTLYVVGDDHERLDLVTGTLLVYDDHFRIGEHTFDFAGITSMSLLYFGKSILFTCAQGYFGLTGEHYHAWKSDRLYRRYLERE